MVAVNPGMVLNPILEEIRKLVAADAPDPFSVRRVSTLLERAINSKSIEPAEYHMANALIELAKKERELALSATRNAVKLGSADAMIQQNAMIVFSSTVSVSDGVALVNQWAANFPDDKEMLRAAALRACEFLQFEVAEKIALHFDQISRNDLDYTPILVGPFAYCSKAAKSYGLGDADLAARLEVAVKSLIELGYLVWRSSRSVLYDGSIIYSLHIDASPEDCAGLNFDIADALICAFDDPGAEFLSINCRPLSDIAQLS